MTESFHSLYTNIWSAILEVYIKYMIRLKKYRDLEFKKKKKFSIAQEILRDLCWKIKFCNTAYGCGHILKIMAYSKRRYQNYSIEELMLLGDKLEK
jgi:hypothetical protein